MDHALLQRASFWLFLFAIDQDLADGARQKACPCGGRLHCANFPRKPRGGGAELPEQYGHRLSFCGDREGCRKRVTPPSVRFLGRKVCLGAVVVLVAAMRQGATPRRVCELSKSFGAGRRIIARWQAFWREHFPQTPFWKVARAQLEPAVVPLALVQAFLRDGDPRQGWGQLLRFLAPITVQPEKKITAMATDESTDCLPHKGRN